jgi:pyridinium-3,5-bisthiocarboxylic acid mononucleotide nickel chelatase
VIGWLDCSAGVSGDMLLGALVGAGVDVAVLQRAVDAVSPEPVALRVEPVLRGGLAATRVHVEVADSATSRSWADIRALLDAADLDPPVRDLATRAFTLLAEAEAAVHGTHPDDVHFHEVGALDAIADVVGAAAGLTALGLTQLTCSPVALGSGTARTAHGPLPVPVPAVVALAQGVPVVAGAVPHEAATPTGLAVVRAAATGFGVLPSMVLTTSGTGAGGRDPAEAPNVVRLLLGTPTGDPTTALVLETNVDDLDPRLWPEVLRRLMAAGASDAWLTPILMKKGRPAHTLSVLCTDAVAAEVRRVVFTETTTIGMRESRVGKTALARSESVVDVDGQQVRVKTATLDGSVVNRMPEYDDVVAASLALGRPVREVLEQARRASG